MSMLRIAGGALLAVAAVVLTMDIMTTISSGGLSSRPLGQHWFDLHPPSLNFSQALIQRYVHPSVWDPAMVLLLNLPAWLVFGTVGLAFLFVRRSHSTPVEREGPLP